MRIRIPLRYKFLFVLGLFTLSALLTTFYLALEIFKEDKISYVFEATTDENRSLAAEIKSGLHSKINLVLDLVESGSIDRVKGEDGTLNLPRSPEILSIAIYEMKSKDEPLTTLFKAQQASFKYQFDYDLLQSMGVEDSPALIWSPEQRTLYLCLAGKRGDEESLVWTVAAIDPHAIARVLSRGDLNESYLIDQRSLQAMVAPVENAEVFDVVLQWLRGIKVSQTTQFIEDNGISYIAAAKSLGFGDIYLVSLADKKIALEGADRLTKMGGQLFLLLVSLVTMGALISTKKITFGLHKLVEATEEVSKGNFDVNVKIRSNDELGTLSDSFVSMARRISNLLNEMIEKGRMDSELKTAEAVQESLFPESMANFGSLRLSGTCIPSSECSGDWWYYFSHGEKVYVLICDATGHGASAALITSAARSIVTVAENDPKIGLEELCSLFNRAITGTAKGKLMMTGIFICIDKATGEVSYVNASHEPAIHLVAERFDKGLIDKNAIEYWNQGVSPRMGDSKDGEFVVEKVQLQPGDKVVLYTDGITERLNAKNRQYGERKFVKSIIEAFGKGLPIDNVANILLNDSEKFSDGVKADDDVTLVLLEYASNNERIVSSW